MRNHNTIDYIDNIQHIDNRIIVTGYNANQNIVKLDITEEIPEYLHEKIKTHAEWIEKQREILKVVK